MAKIGFQQNEKKTDKEEDDKVVYVKNQNYIKTPVEAAMTLSDQINQAYIRTLFSDTHVVSG